MWREPRTSESSNSFGRGIVPDSSNTGFCLKMGLAAETFLLGITSYSRDLGLKRMTEHVQASSEAECSQHSTHCFNEVASFHLNSYLSYSCFDLLLMLNNVRKSAQYIEIRQGTDALTSATLATR
jgi:hypothetical protein